MQLSFRPGVALLAGALSLSLGACLTSCNGGSSYSKTKSGIEYKLFKKEGGKYVAKELPGGEDPTFKDRQGKFLMGHIYILTGKDSLVQSSRQQVQNRAVPLPLMPVTHKGGQEEAFAMVQPGDSAVFRFNADSLFKGPGRQVPKELKRSGNVLVMRIVGVKVVDQAEAMAINEELRQVAQAEQQRQMRAYAADQDKKDDITIQDYLKKNNLTAAKKMPSGIYILTTQPGSGPNVKPGQSVSVQYKGVLLDGKEFDSSAKHGGAPFDYTAGVGQVIPGWDEAVQQLNKGSKATVLIPSSLAYGKAGSPPAIPGSSPLRFDLEIVNVADAKAPAMAPMPAPAPPTPAPAKPAK